MKTIVFHSFARGVGRSNLAANLAVLLAARGRAVALVDANLLEPSLHLLFSLVDEELDHCLNAFLLGQCSMRDAVHDLTPGRSAGDKGHLYLVPATPDVGEVMRVLRDGYDVDRLNSGLQALGDELKPDLVLVESHAGLDEQVLNLMAASDLTVIVLHLDKQDYQGTAVIAEVATRLGVPEVALLVNEVPPQYDLSGVKAEVADKYQCAVAGVVPYVEEITALGSGGLFVLRFPNHPVTALLAEIAERLAA